MESIMQGVHYRVFWNQWKQNWTERQTGLWGSHIVAPELGWFFSVPSWGEEAGNVCTYIDHLLNDCPCGRRCDLSARWCSTTEAGLKEGWQWKALLATLKYLENKSWRKLWAVLFSVPRHLPDWLTLGKMSVLLPWLSGHPTKSSGIWSILEHCQRPLADRLSEFCSFIQSIMESIESITIHVLKTSISPMISLFLYPLTNTLMYISIIILIC